jgi:hypothetical protein
MTNEDKPEYTVFYSTGFLCTGGRDGDTLEELVALGDKNFVPEVWSPEVPVILGGSKFAWQLREESIAAGRVIKLIDGKYVPFGLDPLEPVGDDHEGDADAAMIARDGPAKPATQPSGCEYPKCECSIVGLSPRCGKHTGNYVPAKPALPALSIATDLQPASHQVRAAFGSAELVRR